MSPLLLGHRGARGRKSIPENTFASFDQALADGCDGFEFDVRLTADGCALVCHDPQSGGVDIASASRQQSLSLPRFEDVVARYHARAFLDIELKVSGLERTAVAALKEHWPERGLVVSSFLPEVVLAMQAEDAAIPVGLICETRAELLACNPSSQTGGREPGSGGAADGKENSGVDGQFPCRDGEVSRLGRGRHHLRPYQSAGANLGRLMIHCARVSRRRLPGRRRFG